MLGTRKSSRFFRDVFPKLFNIHVLERCVIYYVLFGNTVQNLVLHKKHPTTDIVRTWSPPLLSARVWVLLFRLGDLVLRNKV